MQKKGGNEDEFYRDAAALRLQWQKGNRQAPATSFGSNSNDNVKKLHQLQYSEIVSDTCGLASVSAVMERIYCGAGWESERISVPVQL